MDIWKNEVLAVLRALIEIDAGQLWQNDRLKEIVKRARSLIDEERQSRARL